VLERCTQFVGLPASVGQEPGGSERIPDRFGVLDTELYPEPRQIERRIVQDEFTVAQEASQVLGRDRCSQLIDHDRGFAFNA